ncbi:M23 family metallopeptidase [Brevundimonas sp. Root1279]|uniref:M23 family metallopeptidase n=1 Tax=Brevundimonas sp. Root1279 TaxID=1736443 RepID=UPI0007133FA2|nr:M23 family metallopeptidase [Brevundimonas sp. Root1279]KQW83711.1 hypothetical protein ASC65_03395 [Brevundimonas sp. Root1279]
MMRISVAMLAVLGAALPAGPALAQVEGRILPEKPFVEQTRYGQALNFDLALTNQGAHAVEVSELEVTFIGADGRALLTRRLDGNGSAPSIQTLPDRTLDPGEEQLLFNPFEYAPAGRPVASVRIKATLSAEGQDDVVVTADSPVRAVDAAPGVSPVTGRVLVWDGHDALSHHRRWDYLLPPLKAFGFSSNAMRYSYDFVPVDAEGRMHSGDGADNSDWFGFGQPVRVPSAGVVVQVRDDRPDDRQFDPATLKDDINLVFGNVVVIDRGDGTFDMLGHIQQGSAKVRVGDRVEPGQTVAAIGASGSSLFPHLHYQRVDAADMRGEGVPSTFSDLVLDDGSTPVNGHVDSGEIFVAR